MAETRGDESLQRLLGNPMPGRMVVHRDESKKRVPNKDFAGVEGHKRTIDEIYGVGNEVVAKWHIQAVVKSEMFGLKGKGQTIDIIEVAFIRFDKEGRMTQGWFRVDSAELLRQLGVAPIYSSEALEYHATVCGTADSLRLTTAPSLTE